MAEQSRLEQFKQECQKIHEKSMQRIKTYIQNQLEEAEKERQQNLDKHLIRIKTYIQNQLEEAEKERQQNLDKHLISFTNEMEIIKKEFADQAKNQFIEYL